MSPKLFINHPHATYEPFLVEPGRMGRDLVPVSRTEPWSDSSKESSEQNAYHTRLKLSRLNRLRSQTILTTSPSTHARSSSAVTFDDDEGETETH